jgi:hypothetical protein
VKPEGEIPSGFAFCHAGKANQFKGASVFAAKLRKKYTPTAISA